MSALPVHTFVVVAYKKSPYLETCLTSLKQQRVRSHIVITTSTPSAFLEAIAQAFAVPLMINPAGGGIAADWNFAYRQAETPYVTLAHQDDFYEENYTEVLLKRVVRYPDLLIAFTNYRELHGQQKKNVSTLLLVKRLLLAPFWLWPTSNRRWVKQLILSTGNPICCPSVWFNKRQIGEFAFSDQYRVNLDWDAWRRLAAMDGSFMFVASPLVCHRKHEASESTVTIRSAIRRREDTALLSQTWGNTFGRLISAVYALGYVAYKPLLQADKTTA